MAQKQQAASDRALRADTFQRYLNDVGAEDLLDAENELAIARELEALEIDHWRQLLSHAPALDTVITAIEPLLPEMPPELGAMRRLAHGKRTATSKTEASWVRHRDAAATRLRELDLDRSARSAADQAVREAYAGTRGFAAYLSRVAKARAAETRTKNRFVAANLRLVVTIARRYRTDLMPLADVVQEGNLGLIRAVERFDHRRGYRFSTYASWWIRHGVTRALADKARLVRVPVHALDDARRVQRTQRAHAERTGQTMSVEAVAAELDMPVEKVAALVESNVGFTPFSLDAAIRDDSEMTWLDRMPTEDQLSPEESLESSDSHASLERVMQVLTPFEAKIIGFRFGLGGTEELTLREIGDKYNLSRERIRQLQEQALEKLRRAMDELQGGDERGESHAA